MCRQNEKFEMVAHPKNASDQISNQLNKPKNLLWKLTANVTKGKGKTECPIA